MRFRRHYGGEHETAFAALLGVLVCGYFLYQFALGAFAAKEGERNQSLNVAARWGAGLLLCLLTFSDQSGGIGIPVGMVILLVVGAVLVTTAFCFVAISRHSDKETASSACIGVGLSSLLLLLLLWIAHSELNAPTNPWDRIRSEYTLEISK